MLPSRFLSALLLALPLAAAAQTTPAPQQKVTEVTEELDPATGKVIKRTTRTIMEPAGTTVVNPSSATTTTTADVTTPAASDATVSAFFREKTVVARLTAPQLQSAYNRFIEKVRDDRRGWQTADWANAAAVLSSLNTRYDQLRDSFTLDDKVTIRSQQGEFQALRTARQISKSVSDKL